MMRAPYNRVYALQLRLLLRFGGCGAARLTRRRSAWSRARRSRLRQRAGRARWSLRRIRLIVKFHDVLGNIDLIGSVNHRRILRRNIEDHRVAVLLGILVNYIEHFASDAVHDLALVLVPVFLELLLLALIRTGQPVAFLGEASLFLIAEGGRAVPETRLQVFDLLPRAVELRLSRIVLSLQVGGRLFAFVGPGDGRLDIDHSNSASPGGGRLLRPQAWNQQEHCESGHDHSNLHLLLLIFQGIEG